MIDDLLDQQRLIVTAGAGGVGKTTIAAALGVRAAARGRRTAVLTIDPARRLAQALGLEELTGRLKPVDPTHVAAAGVELAAPLGAMMLDTKTTGDAMVHRFAPDAAAAKAILENRYYQYFSTSLAGSQEYMAIEQVRELVAEGDYDLIVLDTPPAAHALDFLDAPDRLLEALQSPAMQVIRKSKDSDGIAARLLSTGRSLVLRGLNKMTGGEFLNDLAEFLVTFSAILDALRVASGEVRKLLRSDSTSFLLITTPTPSNLDEARHFRSELAKRGFPFAGFVCNRVHHPVEPVEGLDTARAQLAAQVDDPEPLLAVMQQNLADHNRMAARDLELLQALTQAGEAAPWTVPLLPEDVHDLAGLLSVGALLAEDS